MAVAPHMAVAPPLWPQNMLLNNCSESSGPHGHGTPQLKKRNNA
eukprot:CAMPEP_0177152248 /NCGR_PEP_ID=MMETSP0367-20130122/424_1 /TAXON_ID=447022 ORGANISM="Scrippsiella hangoei-like, Strain SHHI-4" /NCGR_SAMPLE_ID=MMETSP0367 /ASSEMBLY_ACC=CAM_ASM_000362 /LENGTH=43 /DNA_ID= /DNA_START= /DNA_END= /DNA_ORIENTATION=